MKEDFIRQEIFIALLDTWKQIRDGDIDSVWKTYNNMYQKLSQFIDEDEFEREKRKIIFGERETQF